MFPKCHILSAFAKAHTCLNLWGAELKLLGGLSDGIWSPKFLIDLLGLMILWYVHKDIFWTIQYE